MRKPFLCVNRAVWIAALPLAVAAAGCASGGGGSRPAAAGRQSSAAAGCSEPAANPDQVVDAKRPAQDPQALQGIVVGMCLSDVLARVGPAHRYVASTPFLFEWKATDGRTFQVGIPSLRDRSVYARWAK
jgi:hypothetical protein